MTVPASTPTVSTATPQASPALSKQIASAKLAENCDFISLDGSTAAVVLCRPEEDGFWEKLYKDSPSLILSFVAIVLSIFALYFSNKQQKRGIVQSIKDDYWLRTLVSPVCIAPLIELRQEILSNFPDGTIGKADLQKFSALASIKLSHMQDALDNLSIVDASLVGLTRDKLTDLEDVVGDYVALLGQHINDPGAVPAPDAATYRTRISSKFFEVLKPIQEHQLNQGSQ